MSKRTHPLIDEERQKIARSYRRDNMLLSVGSLIISTLFLAAILFFEVSEGFVELLSEYVDVRSLIAALYFSVLFATFSFLTLPFGYGEGDVIEHKYGFSRQARRGWLVDWLKSFFVTYVIGLLVFETIYLLIPASPTLWWLWFSLIMIGFSVILTNIFPVVILPLFYKSSPLEDEELSKEITDLCGRVGVGVRGVYSLNLSSKTTKANAAVVGIGNTKRILIGDTLLSKYRKDEILSAVAHEIVHYSERHMWWLILWQSISTLIMFYLFFRIQPFVYAWFGFQNASEIAAFPVFAIVFSVISYVFKPVGAALSRYYERRADRGALNLTGDAEAFANLIAKFCNEQLSIAFPNRFIEWYKYSHPSPGKRIEFAEKWRGNDIRG